eukprot:6479081-Pyramimonas_sp.AAC.1
MQSMVPSLQCTRTTSSLVSEVVRALDISSIDREAKEWSKLHRHTTEADCPKLHAPVRPRRWCWEAGYCICSGPSTIVKRFHSQLTVLWRRLKHILGDKTFNQKLEGGVFVLRLTCVGVPMHEPPQSVADPGSAIVPAGHAPGAEWLLQVALHYGRPWRPTFSRMRWEPLEDRAGILGVAPERDDAGGAGPLLHNLTVFEVARKCFDAAWTKRPIQVQVHELVADGRRVALCQPSRQRILAHPLFESDIWELKPPPPRPRKRKAPPMKGPRCGPGPKPKAAPDPALEDDHGGSTDEMDELEGMPAVEDDGHADV